MSNLHATTPTTYLDTSNEVLDHHLSATALRNAFRLNGEFSGVTGLVATIAPGPVADLLGVDQVWAIRSLGIALLGFAVFLFVLAGQRNSAIRAMAVPVSVADIGWVVATAVVIGIGWLSTEGAVAMGVIAGVVLAFAVAQLRARAGLLAGGPNEAPPVELVRVRRSLGASAEALWPVMTDHELYADLALNLKAAANLSPNGPGLRRSCTDTSGRTWGETCTRWDDGSRFDVDIEITRRGSDDGVADYPYPLQTMQGGWAVEPTGSETADVTMTFAFQPEAGFRGRLFVPMMHVLFRPILRRIARGWERAAAGNTI